jgi:hypothetical protein
MSDIYSWIYQAGIDKIVRAHPGAFEEFTCAGCGQTFYKRIGKPWLTCSRPCSRINHEQKRGGPVMDNITTFDFTDLARFDRVFCLVSGGIDSTYLWEMVKHIPHAVAVNCWNPYEGSPTLDTIRQDPRFIEVRPVTALDYRGALVDSFKRLPEAYRLKRAGKYHKKIFPCCRFIKHEAFLHDPTFTQPNTVVISGIKTGDGQQRRFWLQKLRKERTFYHIHAGGQNYVYPFRDYRKRELPRDVLATLRRTYPTLKHSGCAVCPVLVLFTIRSEGKRYRDSVAFWHRLQRQPTLDDYEMEVAP